MFLAVGENCDDGLQRVKSATFLCCSLCMWRFRVDLDGFDIDAGNVAGRIPLTIFSFHRMPESAILWCKWSIPSSWSINKIRCRTKDEDENTELPQWFPPLASHRLAIFYLTPYRRPSSQSSQPQKMRKVKARRAKSCHFWHVSLQKRGMSKAE